MENASFDHTIVAIATPPGRGGVGIVRLSGSKSSSIAAEITQKTSFVPRHAHFVKFFDDCKRVIDTGLVLSFPGPNSFTGEDVVELHAHGSPVVLEWLVEEAVRAGARMARPGEFTERAFLNNKIDLIQAEAVAQVIHASSRSAAKAAQNSLRGFFSSAINKVADQLITLRLYVEAAIDFPEEEIDFLADSAICGGIEDVLRRYTQIMEQAEQSVLLEEGVTVTLVGKPNVGKSSLLNCLSGEAKAIVTEVPGTTRDIVSSTVNIAGIPIRFLDTAGIRKTNDIVEQEGIKRSQACVKKSDIVLLVLDGLPNYNDIKLDYVDVFKNVSDDSRVVVLVNKQDLWDTNDSCARILRKVPYKTIALSAKQSTGIELLCGVLEEILTRHGATEGEQVFLARRRHLEALKLSKQHVEKGKAQLLETKAGELLAEELRLALGVLEEMIGAFTPDDLLGKIFSEFCIGK